MREGVFVPWLSVFFLFSHSSICGKKSRGGAGKRAGNVGGGQLTKRKAVMRMVGTQMIWIAILIYALVPKVILALSQAPFFPNRRSREIPFLSTLYSKNSKENGALWIRIHYSLDYGGRSHTEKHTSSHELAIIIPLPSLGKFSPWQNVRRSAVSPDSTPSLPRCVRER